MSSSYRVVSQTAEEGSVTSVRKRINNRTHIIKCV